MAAMGSGRNSPGLEIAAPSLARRRAESTTVSFAAVDTENPSFVVVQVQKIDADRVESRRR